MIELHPENGSIPIIADWKGVPSLYLVGGSAGIRLNTRIEPGDMPLAVLTRANRGVTIAPVHPLCHASAEGQAIATLSSGDALQLGADHFRIIIGKQSAAHFRKTILRVGIIVIALLCGWVMRDFLSPQHAAVTTTDLYTF